MRKKREAPEIGTSEFLPTTKDDRVILGKNSDRRFSEEDTSVVVAQLNNDHQVLMKVRHYVAAIDGELWEEQVTQWRENNRGATGGADYNLARRRVNVGTGDAWGHVGVTCTRVGNISVGLG